MSNQIKSIRRNLRLLAVEETISQYLEDCLTQRRQEINTFHASIADPDSYGGIRYPSEMSKLFEQVLLYVGDKPKAFYIQQTFLLSKESTDLEYRLEEVQELYQYSHQLTGEALEVAQQLLSKAEGVENNEQINSPLRMN